MAINTISQFSPFIVVLIAFYYRAIWDKGLRALFYLYLTAGLFEIASELTNGAPLIYHLWTPIEVGFLLYIYNQWSDLNYKAIFIAYMIIWVIIKTTGLESLQGLGLDIISMTLASLIFIIIPMYVFEGLKSYQRIFMLVMSIYFGGCLVFFITINTFENKVLAWEVHSIFNIIAALASAGIYFIRNREIVLSNRSFVSDSLPYVRKD